ncbi:hypothetical protein ABG067_007377 [Albugo candida]|uniref:Uncharacterized protein n=1 Tax=Albugo candida TaxID=65357 RepID=A0A024GJX2_9STRA|nr:unnamed protein product [Albugo candida]|eukprot:CCI46812.1 unnamed protein product [Albugo candida]
MARWFRFLRAKVLRPNEVQAKIPTLADNVKPGHHEKRRFTLIPVRDPEIYPLLCCVTLGFGLLAVYSAHAIMYNPDLSLNKERRETPVIDREQEKDAEHFTSHRARLATLRPNPVNTSEDTHPQQSAS